MGTARTRRWWWAVGAAALAAGLLALLAGWPGGGLRALPRWEAGREYRYRLDWTVREQTSVGGGAADAAGAQVDGRFALRGRLVLRGLGQGDAAGAEGLVGLSLADLEVVRFELLGGAVGGGESEVRSQLTGHEAALRLEPGGRVREARFPAAAPPLFAETVLAILSDAGLDLRRGERAWSAVEAGRRGEAEVAWTARRGEGADVATRVKRRYTRLHAVPGPLEGLAQRLSASTTVEVTPRGTLRRLTAFERLSVGPEGTPRLEAEVALRLELEAEAPLPDAAARRATLAAAVDQAAPRTVEAVPGQGDPARADVRAAGGTDLAVVTALLRTLAAGGTLPDDFNWRGGAWLRLHPEALGSLAALFDEPALGEAGRLSLVSLLVSAGSPEAQATLRALVGAAGRREEAGFSRLVTELSWLEAPEPATLTALGELAAAPGPARTEATYALGAAIRRAPEGEAREAARALDDQLVAELRTASDPERRRALLGALTNAGRPEHLPELEIQARDPSPGLRAAAATALRLAQSAGAEALLVGLCADPDLSVQAAAAGVLASYRVGDPLLSALAERIRAGGVHELNYPALLNLVTGARSTASPEARRGLLQAMAASPMQRPEIRERVEFALGALP